MKKIYLLIFLLLFSITPLKTKALTEDEARSVITNYANYLYENKKDEIVYVSPKEVQQQKIFLGYTTKNNKYAMDCNAFVGFVIYNAFQIQADSNGKIPNGELTTAGRPALNGINGWSSHSSLYDSKRYMLKQGETIQKAVKRIDLKSKLKPGDLIAVVGFSSSSYASESEANKSAHIMLYLGDGKYIHNASAGVKINDLSNISYGSRVGSSFPDSKGNMGPHGAITVLTLQNFDKISQDALNGFRFPTGDGQLKIEKTTSSNPCKQNVIPGHYELIPGIKLCERNDVAKIVKIINTVLTIIRVVVPILLIISIMIKLVHVVYYQEDFDNYKKAIVTNIIAAILVFLIPTFVNVIMQISSVNISFDECVQDAQNPKNPYVWVDSQSTNPDCNESTNPEGQNDGDNNTNTDEYSKTGTYITLSNTGVTGYYFSNTKQTLTSSDSRWIPSTKNKIDFNLLPGKYYVYIRTNNGIKEKEINVSTKDIVVTFHNDSVSMLTTSIDEFLLSKGSSLTEFNEAIARSVYIAGGSNKNGAAAAALALSQILYNKYRVRIPYGHTKGDHIVVGVPNTWGAKSVRSDDKQIGFTNQGIHCGGFVSWAYTQANFKMSSGIGSSKQLCSWGYSKIYKMNSSSRGNIGDVATIVKECDKSGHVGIIVAMDDNGFYVVESNVKTDTVNGNRKIKDYIGIVTTYETFSDTRFKSYLDMTSTINSKLKSSSLSSGF